MKKERIFWGLFFILAAIFMIWSGLGGTPQIGVFKLLLTVLFVSSLLKSIVHFRMSGILFSVAFLAILYDKLLGITEITPWPVLGAALLGSIGWDMIFGHQHKTKVNHTKHRDEDIEDIEYVEGNQLDFQTKFGASIKYVTASDMQRVNLDCSFGAMKIYFDQANICGDQAVVDVDVSFGGVELYVPKEWNTIIQVDCSLAGVEEKYKMMGGGKPSLYVTGKASFAGVTVIYV